MVDTQASVRIVVPDGEMGDAQERARQAGLDMQILPKKQVVDPFTWILIGGAALATAKFINDLVEHSRGGLVVDLGAGEDAKINRNADVPYGWVLIISPDGKHVRIEVHDAPKDAAERLLSEIISGGYKTAADIAKAARNVLPEGSVTE
jgi:hypothetical protein